MVEYLWLNLVKFQIEFSLFFLFFCNGSLAVSFRLCHFVCFILAGNLDFVLSGVCFAW